MEGSSEAETLLLETLGLPFLAFVLNADEERIAQRLESGATLSNVQKAALVELVAILGSLAHARAQSEFLLALELRQLAEYRPQFGTSWATAKHIQCGGKIDLPEPSDSLDEALLVFIKDTYAANLLPSPGPWPESGTEIAVLRHPQHVAAERAVRADEALAKLFPDCKEDSGHVGQVYKSTGSGGTIQASMFASVVLKNGWKVAEHRHGLQPMMRQWAEATREVVRDARRAATGKKVSVTALVGVTGMRLPEGSVLTLPWGRLREATDADRRLIPSGLSGQLTTTTPDGSQVAIDYAGDLVMDMDVPYKVKVGGRLDPGVEWPVEMTSAEIVAERLETLRLGFLLALDRESPAVALGTWQVFLDPLASGGMSWSDPRRNVGLTPLALTEDEAATWCEWIERIHSRRVKSIEVAVRRTLRAAAERHDPTDGLVDAVIAWENLFGSKEGESTLRVAAAMGWLLGDDGAERSKLRRQVAKLYGLRSDVVHGKRFLKPSEASEKYREALHLTIKTLRKIFRDRADLLTSCDDSGERSLRLILDNEPSSREDGQRT